MKLSHLSNIASLIACIPASLLAGEWASAGPGGDSLASGSPGLHFGFDPLEFSSGMQQKASLVGGANYLHRFESDFDSLPGDISSDDSSIFVPILPLSYDRWRIMVAASYRATWFDTSTPTLIPDEVLHAFRLPVGVLYDVSDKWLVAAMTMPGYAGDLSSASGGFSILSVLGVGYSVSPDLKVLGGVLYNHGFDENLVLPGVGVLWQPAPAWSVSLLPPFASVSYRMGDDYILSLFGRYDGTTWNVEADGAGPERDIQIKEVRAGLRLERRLTGRFWAYLAGGINFARRLEVETTSSASLQESDIDPGAFVQAGLNLRF